MTLIGGQDTGLGNVDTASEPGGEDGGQGTLASIYAFGLAHDPAVDNVFNMPGGLLAFPGNTDWGTGRTGSEIAWFQSKSAIDLSEPPPYELISQAWQNDGVGGIGCGIFRIDELNDPNWNGSFSSIGGATTWFTEQVAASNDPDQTSAHTNSIYGQTSWDSDGGSPKVPGGGNTSFAQEKKLALWNQTLDALTPVEVVGGFGNVDRALFSAVNGANAQWITHWNNGAAVPAAGDGPTWWIDNDGRLDRFSPAAGLQAYQRTADDTKAWGWRLFGLDATPTLQTILDVNTDGGTLNGLPITTAEGTVIASFVTPTIDFLAAAATYSFNTPTNQAGKRFHYIGGRYEIATQNANVVTGFNQNLSQDGVDVGVAATLTGALFNQIAAPYSVSGNNSAVQPVDTTVNPLQWRVISPASGVGLSDFTGRVVAYGYYDT